MMDRKETKMYQKGTSNGCGCSHVKSSEDYPMNYPMHQCHTYKMENYVMDEYPMDDYNSESFSDNANLYSGNSLENMPLGMSYVPWQKWNCAYDMNQGIQAGTIFPELELPFTGKKCGCGMRGDGKWK